MICVIIPTCLASEKILNCIKQITSQISEDNICVISVNPTEEGSGRVEELESAVPDNCFVHVISHKQESYGRAVNEGIKYASTLRRNENGLTNAAFGSNLEIDYFLICNDDVIVSSNFEGKVCSGFDDGHVVVGNTVVDKSRMNIGISVPNSNNCIGTQMVDISKFELGNEFIFSFEKHLIPEKIERQLNPVHKLCDIFSGFCFAISKECYSDISIDGNLFDEVFNENGGGSEDRDLNVRVLNSGYRCVISNCFVYHFANETKKITNECDKFSRDNDYIFYDKWSNRAKGSQLVICSMVATLKTHIDVICFCKSINYHSNIFDGFSIVFNGSPFEFINNMREDEISVIYEQIGKEFADILSGKIIKNPNIALDVLVRKLSGKSDEFLIKTDIDKYFNVRSLRNLSNRNAEKLGAGWVFHLEQDEIIEQRVGKEYIRRLCNNPDPTVLCYNFSTITHWNTDSQYINNFPYGDKGSYVATLNSNRMYRVVGESSIHDGYGEHALHCSFIPYFDTLSVRYCNIRLRKYGLIDFNERWKKYFFMSEVDKSPNKDLVGYDNYNHYIIEELANVSLFSGFNGCDLHMIFYSGEPEAYIIDWLNIAFPFFDNIHLTWTDEKDIPDNLERLIGYYGAKLHHVVYEDDLAKCRNKSIEITSSYAKEKNIGWNIVFDPDEKINLDILDSIRSMLNSTKNLAFEFKFLNLVYDANGGVNNGNSKNIRLFRSLSPYPIRFKGKIHETVSFSLLENRKLGVDIKVGESKFHVINGPSVRQKEKIENYAKSLIKSLEENPVNPEHWLALASQCGQDKREADKLTCLQNAIRCEEHGLFAGEATYFECMAHYLVMAKKFLPKCRTLLGVQYEEMHKFLEKYAIEQLIVDSDSIDYEIPEFKID
tara:strand:- start:30649 stop:33312 length:2664 start_codon:yes stop_codon:yes gene_type:complete